MGLFDSVVIEGLKLKQPKELAFYLKQNNTTLPPDFQTKDLDCSMTTYKIDAKGQIFETNRVPTGKKIPFAPFRLSWVDERPFLERLYIKYRDKEINKKYPTPEFVDEYKSVFVKSKITQTFNIYNYTEIAGRYVDITYEVIAEKGKVVSIKLKDFSIESLENAIERKKDNDIFQKNMDLKLQKRRELRSKWYYPILRETYTPLVFFTKKLVEKICQGILKSSVRWHGV